MAEPAVRPKLRWIAVSPSPMVRGTRLLWIFMLLSSVTARMTMSSMAVPSIWSMARLTVVTWWHMLLVQIYFVPAHLFRVKEWISFSLEEVNQAN